jgi:hypothetical protein
MHCETIKIHGGKCLYHVLLRYEIMHFSIYCTCMFFTSVRINSGFSHIYSIIRLVFVAKVRVFPVNLGKKRFQYFLREIRDLTA